MHRSHTRQTSGFLSLAALKLITAEMCCFGRTKCCLQTVFSLSLPSSVVCLFLPWGGDGRFLQGKSNNLSHHQMSTFRNHRITEQQKFIEAIFLVIAGKIVHTVEGLQVQLQYALPLTGSAWTQTGFGFRLVLFLLILFFMVQQFSLLQMDLLPPECHSDFDLVDPVCLCDDWMPLAEAVTWLIVCMFSLCFSSCSQAVNLFQSKVKAWQQVQHALWILFGL